MLVLVLLFTLGLGSQNKMLADRPEKHIAVELGQSYEENVPLLFKQFQHTRLEEVRRDSNVYEQPICEIKLSEGGLIKLVTQLDHNSTSHVSVNDRIVYQFEELKSLRIFVNAIQVGSSIVAAYSTKEVIVYSLDNVTGFLKVVQKIAVPGEAIQQAVFAQVSNQLLLFTNRGAFLIDLHSGSCNIVAGYQPQEGVQVIQSLRSDVLVGEGAKGLAVYHFNQQNNTLEFLSRTTFTVNSTPFDADTFQLDSTTNMIYVLDREEGVIAADLTELKNSTLQVSKMWILMGGCQNLLVTAYHIYLTCPELIQYKKESGQPLNMQHNSFYPFDLQLAGQRIFLYGHQEMAVFDLFGNVLEQHQLHLLAEKSFVVSDFIVSFTDSFASSSLIVPQREALYCYTSDEDRTGKYKGSYIVAGLCSEYFESPVPNTQICEVKFPFKLKIQNSAVANYRTELIILLVWLLTMFIIGIAFGISHYIAHSSYKELVEEQSKQGAPIATIMKQKQQSIQQFEK